MDPFDPAAASHDRFSASAEAGSGSSFDGVVEECAGASQGNCPHSCWWCVEQAVCAAHPADCLTHVLAHAAGANTTVSPATSSAWVMVLVAVLGVGLVAALFVASSSRRRGDSGHAGRLSPVDMELSTSFDRAEEHEPSLEWRGGLGSGAVSSTPPRHGGRKQQQPAEGRRLLDDE
jgi:hypothetical protein